MPLRRLPRAAPAVLLLGAILLGDAGCGGGRAAAPADPVARIDAAFARLDRGERADLPDAARLSVPPLRRARDGFDLFAGVLMILRYWKAEQGGLFDKDYADQYALARDAVKLLSLLEDDFRPLRRYARFGEREWAAADLSAFRPFGTAMDRFLRTAFASYGVGYRADAAGDRPLDRLRALVAAGAPPLVGVRTADERPVDVLVVSGYDRRAGTLRVVDPAVGAERTMEEKAFLAAWGRAGRPWAALVAVRGEPDGAEAPTPNRSPDE